jgi:sugar phosphate isomerase/epimerase
MRFGGLIFTKWTTPDEWAQAAIAAGYTAVYFPLDYYADTAKIDQFVAAAKENDLLIAELGVWNNTLDADSAKRESAISHAIRQLELADYVGAKCCVNVAGSFGNRWDGPHRENLTKRGQEAVILTTQRIIDAVNPRRARYCLEPMPWMYPNTADSYLELLSGIDRKGFGVHIDIVNIINSPVDYFQNGQIIKEWFAKLGSQVVSCHGKDIRLGEELTVHLSECRPGTGELDYRAYLSCIEKLNDVPLMLEHMSEEVEYQLAMRYLNSLLSEMKM